MLRENGAEILGSTNGARDIDSTPTSIRRCHPSRPNLPRQVGDRGCASSTADTPSELKTRGTLVIGPQYRWPVLAGHAAATEAQSRVRLVGVIAIAEGKRATWRLSLKRTGIRRRRPYCARHSSVSWNLMIGKNPLWVAKQHGHSVQTMLETYAAWTEGAQESDIEAIRRAMADTASCVRPTVSVAIQPAGCQTQIDPLQAPEAG